MLISRLLDEFQLKTAAPLAADFEIRGVRPLDDAQPGDLSFLSNPKYRQQVATTRASAVLVKQPLPDCTAVQILCGDPYLTLAKILTLLYPEPVPRAGVHVSAVVAPGTRIGERVTIGPHCTIEEDVDIAAGTELVASVFVGRGSRIGRDCKLFPNVVLYAGTHLGERVRIHANCSIGADGFGYAPARGVHVKVPQIGSVVIEDDVEIGANSCIDRGALGVTRIGRGTKIDNQVQIAHGVKIGAHSILVSQTGISGSASIGDHVILAGKVGVVGHVHIGDNIVVMGDSVVTKNLTEPGQYAGNPAIPHIQYQRQQAGLRMVAELRQRLRTLEAANKRQTND